MNDFTKEELDYMSDILKIHINDYPTLTTRDSDFLNKLQSMIDNYCEHVSGYIDYDYQATRCKKCLKIIE